MRNQVDNARVPNRCVGNSTPTLLSPALLNTPISQDVPHPAYFNGKQSVGSQSTADLSTAPVLTANSHRKNNSTNSVKFGGPVLARVQERASILLLVSPALRMDTSSQEQEPTPTRTFVRMKIFRSLFDQFESNSGWFQFDSIRSESRFK